MEEIKTIKELNGDADYNVIKAKPEAERVKFPIEHFDAFVLYMRNLLLQKTPMLEEGLEDLQAWKNNFTPQTKADFDLEAYPKDPKGLPVPTAAEQIFEQKADLVNTEFTVLTPIGSTYTLDYDPGKPLYWIDQTANGTVQLESLHNFTKAECLLYVKKQPGSVTLAFRDAATLLTPHLLGTMVTDNGALDVYTIEKHKTRFYIKRESLGLGTEQAADQPAITNPVNLSVLQLPDENGKNAVQIHWDAVTGATYKLIRNESPTATAPTLYESATYPTGGNYKDLGASSGSTTTVLQDKTKYYYRLRVSKAGQETVWYTVEITIQ